MSLSNPLISLALLAPLSAFPPPEPAAPAVAPALLSCDEAYLGVYVTPADEGGATVTRLMPGSPAEAHGLQPGDRIVTLGDTPIGSPEELTEAVAAHQAGDEVELVLHRGDEQLSLGVELGDRAQAEARGDFQPAPVAGVEPGDGFGRRWQSAPALRFELPSVRLQGAAARADGSQHLEQRLDELHQRMDERFEELSRRLQALREERADAGLEERLGRFEAELEADREAQQRRVEELRSALRREAQGEASPQPRASSLFGALSTPQPAGAGPGASAGEIQALREEVRTLREEIRELKELMTR